MRMDLAIMDSSLRTSRGGKTYLGTAGLVEDPPATRGADGALGDARTQAVKGAAWA